jgi:dCTP diphosphatase
VADSIRDLRAELLEFAQERDWLKFHTPKNLAMALGGECGELMALLQWRTDAEIADLLAGGGDLSTRLSDELADVLIYLIRLADVTGIDLIAAVREKIGRNHLRYPSDVVRGRAVKYTDVEDAAVPPEE